MNEIHLLIAGAGHATLPLIASARARKLRGIRTTVINNHLYLYYSGMIPQYLGGVYTEEEVRIDLESLCKQNGADFIQGSILEIDTDKTAVTTETGHEYAANIVVLNTGVVTKSTNDNAKEIPVKPLHKLVVLRTLLRGNPKRNVLIKGGGPAGVEIALNLSHFPELKITITEMSDRLLPAFPTTASDWAERKLRTRNVEIFTGTATQTIDFAYADLIINATGNYPSTARMNHPFKTDKKGRILAEPTLQVKNHPSFFVTGDVACVSPGGYDQIGVHAVKQGKLLNKNIDAVIKGKALSDYKPYPVNPLILSDGNESAMLVTSCFALSGKMYLRLKYVADVRWIKRYRQLPQDSKGSLSVIWDSLKI